MLPAPSDDDGESASGGAGSTAPRGGGSGDADGTDSTGACLDLATAKERHRCMWDGLGAPSPIAACE